MKFITGILLVFISFSGMAQENPKEVVNNFFKEFAEKGAEVKIENYYPVNLWGENADAEMLRFKTSLEEIDQDSVGSFVSTELIEENQVIEYYLNLTYKVIFELQTVQIIFSLYRHEQKWVISDLNVNKYIYDHVR